MRKYVFYGDSLHWRDFATEPWVCSFYVVARLIQRETLPVMKSREAAPRGTVTSVSRVVPIFPLSVAVNFLH